MPEPIRIEFSVVGEEQLDRAFASVERRVRRMQDAQVRTHRQAAAREAAANDNASKATQRAAERAAAASTKAREKAAGDAIKTARRQADAEIREAERAAKSRERIRERSAIMAGRVAEREARAEARARAKVEAVTERGRGRYAGAVTNAGRNVWGSVSGVAGGLGAAAGGYAISSAFLSNVQLQQRAAQLVNATRDKDGRATVTQNELLGTSQHLAKTYGVEATGVMGAMSTIAERAGGARGLNAAKGDLEDLTKTAVAYGVSMEDMGAVVAASLEAGVKPGDELRQLFQDLVAMGKDGSIEVSDLSGELAKLAGIGKGTNLRGGEMIRRVVGMSELAARAAVSPEESRTAMGDVVRDLNLMATSKRFRGTKTKFTNEAGLINDPMAVLPSLIDEAFTTGVGGRKGALALKGEGAFTGNSQKIVNLLIDEYMKGGGAKGGGRAAVESLIAGASGATLAPGERDASLATEMNTESRKLAVAMAELNAEVEKLVPQLAKLAKAMTEITSFVAKNPFTSLGLLVTGSIVKEIAGAGLGAAVRAALTGAMRGVPGTGAAIGAAPGGAAAGVAQIAGAGLAGFGAGTLMHEMMVEPEIAKGEAAGGAGFAASMGITNAMNSGGDAAAKAARLREAAANARSAAGGMGMVAAAQDQPWWMSALSAANPIAGLATTSAMLGRGAASESQGVSRDKLLEEAAAAEAAAKQLDELAAATVKATAAMNAAGDMSNPANPARGPRPPTR